MKIIVVLVLVLGAFAVYVLQKKKEPQKIDPQKLQYSQLDITEAFGDNLRLKPNEWIATTPLNARATNPESMGLPAINADSETVYAIATRMSAAREEFPGLNDGVYCPICHIANIDLKKLHTPCPKCSRKLLKFGWD
jgi:hypothetical protein